MNDSKNQKLNTVQNQSYFQMLNELYIECKTNVCKESRSKIRVSRIRNVSNFVIFQFQNEFCKKKVNTYGKTPDCYIYISQGHQHPEQICIIELKSKSALNKGICQLKNGTRILEDNIKINLGLSTCSLLVQLILGHKGGKNISFFKKKITFERIKFFGKPLKINLIKEQNQCIEIEPLAH